MKNLIITIFIFCTLLPLHGQESATRGNLNTVIQPTIVVVPYVKQGEDARQLVESNTMYSMAISTVQAEFNKRGFNTNDFIQLAKSHTRNDMISDAEGGASDVVTQIISESDADISVEVQINTKSENGTSEVFVELKAAEAISGELLSTQNYTSDKFRTTDMLKLLERALTKINDDFFIYLQNSFNNILQTGRNMNIQIRFADNCPLTAFSRVGTPALPLERQLRNWAKQHSFGGYFKPRVTKNLIDLSIKVPLYDQITGEPYQITDIQDPLLDMLYQIVTDASVEPIQSSGQQITIMIR